MKPDGFVHAWSESPWGEWLTIRFALSQTASSSSFERQMRYFPFGPGETVPSQRELIDSLWKIHKNQYRWIGNVVKFTTHKPTSVASSLGESLPLWLLCTWEVESMKLIDSETFNRLLSRNLFWLHSTGRPKRQPFVSQTSSVTEAPSDEVEAEQEGDEDVEPARVTL